jgi:pimeloyl-ACP methyl ester carboxylesterase
MLGIVHINANLDVYIQGRNVHDYPGFGNTEMPDPFTFDHLADITEQLLTRLGVTRAGWYLQDYGGPIGNRILGRHPERLNPERKHLRINSNQERWSR